MCIYLLFPRGQRAPPPTLQHHDTQILKIHPKSKSRKQKTALWGRLLCLFTDFCFICYCSTSVRLQACYAAGHMVDVHIKCFQRWDGCVYSTPAEPRAQAAHCCQHSVHPFFLLLDLDDVTEKKRPYMVISDPLPIQTLWLWRSANINS